VRKIILLVLFFAFSQTAQLFSQQDSIVKPIKKSILCEVKMHDHTSYKGHIESQTDSLIYLKGTAGVLVIIPKHNVSSIDFLSGRVIHDTTDGKKGMQIHTLGIGSRYYTTNSNAFLFNKGEIYGSDSYFGLGNVNYAFSRNFSLGATGSVIGSPLGINTKANFEMSPKLFLGIEAKATSLTYINQKTYATVGFLKLTYGDENFNLTVYGGFFDVEDWVVPQRRRKGRPARPGNYYMILTSGYAGVAFSSRLSKNAHFVADISVYPGVEGYLASVGVRSTRKQNISWIGGFQYVRATLPALNPVLIVLDRGLILPYLGFSYRF
jgi:hypothetical protein